MNILRIDTSPNGERSTSRRLTARLVANLRVMHPAARVVECDLSRGDVPFLDALSTPALFEPEPTPAQRAALAVSDGLIEASGENHWRPTADGFRLLNDLQARFLR